MPGSTKRKAERFSLTIPAKVSVAKDRRDMECLELLTSNICSGGAFFQTQHTIPVGTEVKIDLVLPIDELKKLDGKKASVKVSGKVIRADQNGMAVCFGKNFKISALAD